MRSLYLKICLLTLLTGLYTYSFAVKANTVWNKPSFNKAFEVSTPLYSYTGNVQFRLFAAGNEFSAYFTDGQRVNFIILQQSTLNVLPANGKYQVDIYESGVSLRSYTSKNTLFLGVDVKVSKDLVKSLGGKTRFGLINTRAAGFIYSYGTTQSYKGATLNTIAEKGVGVIDFIATLNGAKTTNDCDSGGVGSISSSVNAGDEPQQSYGCAVTCKTGYYSCCKNTSTPTPQSCKCLKDNSF
jgi:hypothetical protein